MNQIKKIEASGGSCCDAIKLTGKTGTYNTTIANKTIQQLRAVLAPLLGTANSANMAHTFFILFCYVPNQLHNNHHSPPLIIATISALRPFITIHIYQTIVLVSCESEFPN